MMSEQELEEYFKDNKFEQKTKHTITTLENMKIEISKIMATVGPTVTLYEIVPAPGVRISKTGKRFKIDQAIIWNISDAHGRYCGQAATFDTWQFLAVEAQSDVKTNIQ